MHALLLYVDQIYILICILIYMWYWLFKFQHHTTGINCEKCEDGYFRPSNVPRNHSRPCRKCQCDGPGMTGLCVKDDSHLLEGLVVY